MQCAMFKCYAEQGTLHRYERGELRLVRLLPYHLVAEPMHTMGVSVPSVCGLLYEVELLVAGQCGPPYSAASCVGA